MCEVSEQEAIRKMTNWQRHQWAKAGYPQAKDGHAGAPQRFASLAYGERIEDVEVGSEEESA